MEENFKILGGHLALCQLDGKEQDLRVETAKFGFSMSKYLRIHLLFVVVALLDGFGGQIKDFWWPSCFMQIRW